MAIAFLISEIIFRKAHEESTVSPDMSSSAVQDSSRLQSSQSWSHSHENQQEFVSFTGSCPVGMLLLWDKTPMEKRAFFSF